MRGWHGGAAGLILWRLGLDVDGGAVRDKEFDEIGYIQV